MKSDFENSINQKSYDRIHFHSAKSLFAFWRNSHNQTKSCPVGYHRLRSIWPFSNDAVSATGRELLVLASLLFLKDMATSITSQTTDIQHFVEKGFYLFSKRNHVGCDHITLCYCVEGSTPNTSCFWRDFIGEWKSAFHYWDRVGGIWLVWWKRCTETGIKV